MKLETRIVNIEERISPTPETPHIVYVVHESDSVEERERIRLKRVAEYELENGVQVDSDAVAFLCVEVHGGSGMKNS